MSTDILSLESNPKILIIEYTPSHVFVLMQTLRFIHYEVSIAYNTAEAMELLHSSPANTYSLVFYSYSFYKQKQDMFPAQLRASERSDLANLPIFLTCNPSEHSLLSSSYLSDFQELIVKPYTPMSLSSKIAAWISPK